MANPWALGGAAFGLVVTLLAALFEAVFDKKVVPFASLAAVFAATFVATAVWFAYLQFKSFRQLITENVEVKLASLEAEISRLAVENNDLRNALTALEPDKPQILIDDVKLRKNDSEGQIVDGTNSDGSPSFIPIVQVWCSWTLDIRNLGAETTLHGWAVAVECRGVVQVCSVDVMHEGNPIGARVSKFEHHEHKRMNVSFAVLNMTVSELESKNDSEVPTIFYFQVQDVYNREYSCQHPSAIPRSFSRIDHIKFAVVQES